MAKQIATELQGLCYYDPDLYRDFSNAIDGRPATTHARLIAQLNNRLVELRNLSDNYKNANTRLTEENLELHRRIDKLESNR